MSEIKRNKSEGTYQSENAIIYSKNFNTKPPPWSWPLFWGPCWRRPCAGPCSTPGEIPAYSWPVPFRPFSSRLPFASWFSRWSQSWRKRDLPSKNDRVTVKRDPRELRKKGWHYFEKYIWSLKSLYLLRYASSRKGKMVAEKIVENETLLFFWNIDEISSPWFPSWRFMVLTYGLYLLR